MQANKLNAFAISQKIGSLLGRRITVNFPVNPEKATEAYLRLLEKEGGRADHLRLAKLIYAADRKSLLLRGVPIVGGRYFSMSNGPMISETTNFAHRQDAPGWKEHISPRYGNEIKVLKSKPLVHLSPAEIEIIDSVVAEHASKTTKELVEWCHDNCKEHKNVTRGRVAISVESVLSAGKKSARQIAVIVARANSDQGLEALLAKL